MCRKGLHDLSDPANVYVGVDGFRRCYGCKKSARKIHAATYARPSCTLHPDAGTHADGECVACRSGRALVYRAKPKPPCKSCGSTRRAPAGNCLDCASSKPCLDCGAISPRGSVGGCRCQRTTRARRRRALLRGVPSEPYTVQEIRERDGDDCALCNALMDFTLPMPDKMSVTVDHIVPIVHDGHDVLGNVQLAHFKCNSSKKDRVTPEDYARGVFTQKEIYA